jgi:hypothetical protein
MVNIKRETLNHKSHNRILLAIGEEKDYAASIGKKIGLERSDVKQQLDQLRETNYVILDDTKQHKIKKYYSINWYQLSLEFFKYIENQTKRQSYATRLVIAKNKYFIELIKSAFAQNYDNYISHKTPIKTIEEIFNEIFMQMVFYLPPHHDAELKNMSKKNKKLNSFLEFTKELYDFVLTNQADSVGEFYRRVAEEKLLEEKPTGRPKNKK